MDYGNKENYLRDEMAANDSHKLIKFHLVSLTISNAPYDQAKQITFQLI